MPRRLMRVAIVAPQWTPNSRITPGHVDDASVEKILVEGARDHLALEEGREMVVPLHSETPVAEPRGRKLVQLGVPLVLDGRSLPELSASAFERGHRPFSLCRNGRPRLVLGGRREIR